MKTILAGKKYIKNKKINRTVAIETKSFYL